MRSSTAWRWPRASASCSSPASAWIPGASISALIGADGMLVDNPRHYRDPRTNGMLEKLFAVVPRERSFPPDRHPVHAAQHAVSVLRHEGGGIAGAGNGAHAAVHAGPVQLLADRRARSGADHRQHVAVLQSSARSAGPRNCSMRWACRRGSMPEVVGAGTRRLGGTQRRAGLRHRRPRYGIGGGGRPGAGRRLVLHQLGHVVADGRGTGRAGHQREIAGAESSPTSWAPAARSGC